MLAMTLHPICAFEVIILPDKRAIAFLIKFHKIGSGGGSGSPPDSEYTTGLVSCKKVNQKANFKARNGAFSQHFTGKNQFLFCKSKLFYQSLQYTKITIHSLWEA